VKSELENLNPTRVKLTVEVPFDELKPSLDEAYRKIGGSVTIPGFRKGKVPPRIIDQRFGRAVVLPASTGRPSRTTASRCSGSPRST
jgi:trigger factor